MTKAYRYQSAKPKKKIPRKKSSAGSHWSRFQKALSAPRGGTRS